MNTYRPSMIKLSTAVSRLQESYGGDKIDRQLVLDMLKSIGVQPYKNKLTKDYYIDAFDYQEIDSHISDFRKGAPVDKIFNI